MVVSNFPKLGGIFNALESQFDTRQNQKQIGDLA